ncbi:hypothetical protein M231_03679 [Tremella mesenterica]|uniref:RING-type domain-containing protein n=1 Tax=Tremella mesenterica TaxID=5217 RepID=A0A4Q1BMJ0_TREME|nr:hypothetical protein M231_03679 [Tremella mesenterica]
MPDIPIATPVPRTPQKPNVNMDPSQWLNFSLPPRRQQGPTIPRRSKRGEGWKGGVLSRERYVQANFRFVLKPTEVLSYGAHFADPDISLHWPHILQVLVPTFSAFSVAQGHVSSDPAGREVERQGRMCPICLSKPVAPRMTKCGHIFCFPCILHFIRLSEIPKFAKCPICGDTIQEGMLKSVRYLVPGAMLRSAMGEELESSPLLSPVISNSQHPVPETHLDAVTVSRTQNVMVEFGSNASELPVGADVSSSIEPPQEGTVGDMNPSEQHLPSCTDDLHVANSPRGNLIHMRLIQRPQMTTMALPSSLTWPSESLPPLTAPWYFLPDVLAYSRFMLASPEYMLGELQRELDELQAEWDLLRGDELGRDFVRVAREKVQRQVMKVHGELKTNSVEKDEQRCREMWNEVVAVPSPRRPVNPSNFQFFNNHPEVSKLGDSSGSNHQDNEKGLSKVDSEVIPPNRPVQPNPMPHLAAQMQVGGGKKNRRRNPPINPISQAPSYHFYQSSLGANVFLHPLDIRILLAHYKSYSLFPPRISFSSSGFDSETMTEELRRRAKYLGHLPLGSEVVFVEADLEPLVGKETLGMFEQPLKARYTKRKERTKKEDRARSKWEKAEREKIPGGLGLTKEERDLEVVLQRSKRDILDISQLSIHQYSNSSSPINPTIDLETDDREINQFVYPQPGRSNPISTPGQPTTTTPSELNHTTQMGSWGSRPTFATTLHSAPQRPREVSVARSRRGNESADEDVDQAWAAFERMGLENGNGQGEERQGRRKGKKGTKKVLLFGGGARGA